MFCKSFRSLRSRTHRTGWLVAGTIAVATLLTSGTAAAASLPALKRTVPNQTPGGLTVVDWSRIKAEYQLNRYAAVNVGGAYRSRNFAQGWLNTFDDRGVTIRPDSGQWTWGLELRSYGVTGRERQVAGRPRVTSDKYAIHFQSADFDHWYVNSAKGLEDGFTLARRPGGAAGPLRFRFAVRGGLQPSVTDRTSVHFRDGAGADVLVYNGLRAWDADGKSLKARFEAGADASLQMIVDDSGAHYPITIDPTAQQAYLKASNTGADDNFGFAVGISGNTVVVTAIGESSNATSVNGNQTDNSASNSGAAYVFVRSGSTWTQQAYLKASNTSGSDRFGWSVAMSNDTIVVGAPFEDSNATGIGGSQADGATDAGAAYVFFRSGTSWSQQAYVKASNAQADDLFGWTVAMDADTVVVGAQQESSSATGVNGNQADNSANHSGAAYVFFRSGSSWSQQAYLKPSNTGANDQFSWGLGVSGDTIVAGSRGEDGNSAGVNGSSNENAPDAGAAYVFVRSGTNWSQQAYLKASNPETSDGFGFSVAISVDTIVVGAPDEDSNATGIGGNQADNSAAGSGAAYVFARSGTNWSQQAYLKASNTNAGDQFGYFVGASGNLAVVGAYREDSNATGIGGNGADNSAVDAGAAYLFTRSGSTWSQDSYLKASNTGADDRVGIAVGIDSTSVIVGAFLEDSNATGVNGSGADNTASNSGAGYVFAPAGVSITIASSPSGRTFDVSGSGCAAGTGYTTPAVLSWTPGSSCTVTVNPLTQSGVTGTQYAFSSWENSSTASVRVITAPSSATTYTAAFTTQYQVTTSASPVAGGSVTASAFVNAGSSFVVTAAPTLGYTFSGFTGALTGTTNPQTLTVNGPLTVTAGFAQSQTVSLVALYRFDNTSNLGLDSSSNGNNLTANVGSPASGTGKFGAGGVSLNGSAALTTSTGSVPSGFPTGNTNYSIAAWVKTSATGKGIIGWGNFGSTNLVTALRTDSPGFSHYWWGNDLANNTTSIVDNVFHHVVATFDGSVRKVYVDGTLTASDSPGSSHNASSANFAIGRTNNNEFMNGTLDDVAVFTGALSQAQITAILGGDFSAYGVGKTTPTITWANPAAISYGTALSTTQLNAAASVPGTFAYTPAAGTVLNAGAGQTLSVTFTPTDTTHYNTATATATITVNKVNPVITWATPASITYGTALSATQLNATASVAGAFVYSPAAGSVLNTGTQTLSVTFTPTDATNYSTATGTVQIIVSKAPPTITWANPAAISYGTALSAAQLNATASTAGSFVYTPASGTVLSVGAGQTLSVTFTPTDTGNYNATTATALITVNKATPVITWANPGPITYGTALSAAQLNATATFGGNAVPGTFVYTPVAGSVVNAGFQTLSVTFTPTDTTTLNSATATVTLTVNKATPVISWATPASIIYGTALSSTQLNATAAFAGNAVTGTFTYTPAAGTILNTGNNQSLSVTFAPTDSANYANAAASVLISVTNFTPDITWPAPQDISFGTALSSTQLNATASYNGNAVAGTFAYSPVAGTVLHGGTGQTLSVTFTPTDTNTYKTVTGSTTINVSKVTPLITWNDPAAISYGTPLGATQLNATAAVGGTPTAGTFAYSPNTGTVLNTGTNQLLSVTFTPTNTTDYTTATGTAHITVNKATPTITWANPAAINYGTTLSATQLNAVAKNGSTTVGGTYVYTPAAGAKLSAGTNQTLSVTFTPTDLTNYTTATATAQITVNKTTPTMSWVTPDDIAYAHPLTSAQLSAAATNNGVNVAGTYAYTPAAGTVLNVGQNQTLSVSFTPTDTANYTTASATQHISVVKGTPNLNWPIPSVLTFGTVLTSSAHLNATVTDMGVPVPGTYVYNKGVGDTLFGMGPQTFTVSFTPANPGGYNPVSASVTITVLKIPTMFYSQQQAPINYLTGLPAMAGLFFRYDNPQTNQSEFPTGTFVQSPAVGSILDPGDRVVTLTFFPDNTQQYASVSASTTITINKATPQLTWGTVPPVISPQALGSAQKTATAAFNGNNVPGTFSYSPDLQFNSPGVYQVTATFTPNDTTRYNSASITRPITTSYAVSASPQAMSFRGKYPNLNGTVPSAPLRVTTPISGFTFDLGGPEWIIADTTGGGTFLGNGITRFPTGGARTITLSIPSSTFQPGVYTGAIILRASNDQDHPVSVPVTYTVARKSTYFYPAAGSPVQGGGQQFKSGRIATGDFNGDNYTDMAVVSQTTSQVLVLLGSSAGTYSVAPGSPFSSNGTGPADIVTSDFDKDGIADLAIVNSNSDSTTIFRGTGSGGFSFVRNLATGGAPKALVAGDVNADGFVDLLVANNSTVMVWLGSGATGFASGNGIGVSSPTALALKDVNRDGVPDLVVTEAGNNSVSIFNGNGLGGFDFSVRYGVGSFPAALGLDDFNNDGWPDMVVANKNSGNISLFLGGTSGFSATSTLSVGGAPSAVAIADMNGDGILDIVVPGANGISIQLGNGAGSFSTMFGSPFSTGSAATVNMAIADTNRDARLDIITTDSTTNGVSILAGDLAAPAITWPKPADITYPAPLSSAQQNASASFNGSAVAGTWAYGFAVNTVLNAGNGQTLSVTFTPQDTLTYKPTTQTVQINVLQATPTITWANPAGITYPTALSVKELSARVTFAGRDLPGTAVYTPAAGSVLSPGTGFPIGLVFLPADATNYKRVTMSKSIDVTGLAAPKSVTLSSTEGGVAATNAFLVNYSGNNLSVKTTEKTGTGWLSVTPASDTGGPTKLTVKATPGSLKPGRYTGTLTISAKGLTSISVDVTFTVWNQTGALNPNSAGSTPLPGDPAPLMNPLPFVSGDFDGDGKRDVAAVAGTLSSGQTLTVFFGNGQGGFTSRTVASPTAAHLINSMVAADFNGDGITDLAYSVALDKSVSILVGSASRTFTVPTGSTLSFPSAPVSMAVSDFNRDGSRDIVMATSDCGLYLLAGNGKGALKSSFVQGLTDCLNQGSVVAGDFNRDGNPDAVTIGFIRVGANSGSNVAALWYGDGNGGLTNPGGTSTVPFGSRVLPAAGDTNGDGKLDLAFAYQANGNATTSVARYSTTPQGGFTLSKTNTFPALGTLYFFSLDDFDADGKADLMLSDDSGIGVYTGTGEGNVTLMPGSPFQTPGTPVSMLIDDFNGDFKHDVAILDWQPGNHTLNVLFGGKGKPVIQWTPRTDPTYGDKLTASHLGARVLFGTVDITGEGTLTYTDTTKNKTLKIGDSLCDATITGNCMGNHVITVSFKPTDSDVDAKPDNVTRTFEVLKALPTLTWTTPAAIWAGTPLSGTQLNAVAKFGTTTLLGTMSYNPAPGTVPGVGTSQSMVATFQPADTAHFNAAVAINRIDVNSGPNIRIDVTTGARTSQGIDVRLQLTNVGSQSAPGISVTGLYSYVVPTQKSNATEKLPYSVGTLAVGASQTITLHVPSTAGAKGTKVSVVAIVGYTGGAGSATVTQQVTLP